MNRRHLACAALVLALATEARSEPVDPEARAANRVRVAELDAANAKRAAGQADLLALPGLLADRAKREVVLSAEPVAVNATEPVEFFVVSEESGHDYETLMVAFVKPGDVVRALEFIGLKPGRPVDPRALSFWPKGERVLVSVAWTDAEGKARVVRLEDLLYDRRAGKPLARAGLVYVGSRMISLPDQPGKLVLAADAYDPHSIASNYNEPQTLLDVPRPAVQGDVYRSQTLNPSLKLAAHKLVELRLQPEYVDGRKRVVDLTLTIEAGGAVAGGGGVADLQFRLAGAGDKAGEALGLDGLLKRFTGLVENGQDPFVTVCVDDAAPLQGLQAACRILGSVEGEHGIRVEAPPAGHLFYRAFVPNEEFRDRQNRIAQPWELHLEAAGEGLKATLVQIDQTFKREEIKPDLKVTEIALPEPAALRRELDARKQPDEPQAGLPVILVYASPSITYGRLMAYLRPVLNTHGTVHVFLPADAVAPAAAAPAAPVK